MRPVHAPAENPKKPTRSLPICDAAADFESMKSIRREMAKGRSTMTEGSAASASVGKLSPRCVMAATTKPASASASAVS
jgi:hypothetical protein